MGESFANFHWVQEKELRKWEGCSSSEGLDSSDTSQREHIKVSKGFVRISDWDNFWPVSVFRKSLVLQSWPKNAKHPMEIFRFTSFLELKHLHRNWNDNMKHRWRWKRRQTSIKTLSNKLNNNFKSETHSELFYLKRLVMFSVEANRMFAQQQSPRRFSCFSISSAKGDLKKGAHTHLPNDTLRCEVSVRNTQNVNNQKKISRKKRERESAGAHTTAQQQWKKFLVNYYSDEAASKKKKSFLLWCRCECERFFISTFLSLWHFTFSQTAFYPATIAP